MNNLEIINENDKIIILDKQSNRTFNLNLNNKIPIHGLKKLNQKEILYNKILTHDYAYSIDESILYIQFNINNKLKNHIYQLQCDEIFIDTYIDENKDDITINELKKLIVCLRNQISNLSHKNEILNTELEYMKLDKFIEY